MSKYDELVGKKYNRWTVIRGTKTINKNIYLLCKCECGTEREIQPNSLLTNRTRSCGCYNVDILTKHGLTRTRQYKIWDSMKYRCLNNKCHAYESYGGRGIKICDSWLKFENFWEDMRDGYFTHLEEHGEHNTQIDRIDNNGNYCKENCKWSTARKQQNNRRVNRMIEFNGQSKTLGEWAYEYGINYETLLSRLNSKWSIEEALTKKVAHKK